MAFERLAPPVFAPIRKPTPQEIAEVSPILSEIKEAVKEHFTVESADQWPAGTQCECKRNRRDGSKCGHIWKTRTPGKPNACAKCKQTCWDEEPTQRKRHQIKVTSANKKKVRKPRA